MTQILLQKLILHIKGNKSRIKSLAGAIMSMTTGFGVHQKDIALGIDGKAKPQSKTQRIYRFLRHFVFDYAQITRMILSIFDIHSCILAMDRTNWKFGKNDVNILFLALVIGNISVPIMWQMLPHGGSCSSEFMKDFLQRFLVKFPEIKIKYLLADREFMSENWLEFLQKKSIDFIIPLKSDHKIRIDGELQKMTTKQRFKKLKPLEYIAFKAILWSKQISIYASKNADGDLMVLASSAEIMHHNAFEKYRQRWSIERLFKHLKTGGFDIEKSHITCIERYEKLLAIVSIAAAIIIKQGLIKSEENPLLIKHKESKSSPLWSLFTYGFDSIKHAFFTSKQLLLKILTQILKPPNAIQHSTLGTLH